MVILYPPLPMPNTNATTLRNVNFRFIQDSKPQSPNAIWQAEWRSRITRAQADEVLQAMAGLDIEIVPQAWGVMLPLARQFDRSAYDAAYLTLVQDTSHPLLTGDLRLYNAVHAHLDWVLWIEDYHTVEMPWLIPVSSKNPSRSKKWAKPRAHPHPAQRVVDSLLSL